MPTRLHMSIVVLAALVPAVSAEPPGSLPLDWPMGRSDGTQNVPGYGVRVMQNFANVNPSYGHRRHAGVDLALDGRSAAQATVYAAADGVVTCATTTRSYPGQIVVLEHALSDGTTLHTQYGHLNNPPRVAVGQLVSRGMPIGTVVYQTLADGRDNSHLHFEVRTFREWAPGNCWGPGYADAGLTPSQQGWLDPVAEYFTRRPPFPGAVIASVGTELRNGPSRSGTSVIAQWPAGSALPAYSAHADQSGRPDRWYRVKVNETWGYVQSYWNTGWGGDLLMTERFRDPSAGGPADVVGTDHALHLFARAADGSLRHRTRDGAAQWAAWTDLGGVATSAPVGAMNSDGRWAVFARRADSALWYRQQIAAGGPFAAWTALDGELTALPAVARNEDGRLQAFARWSDGSLRTRAQQFAGSTSWTPWLDLGGILHSAPMVAARHDGRLAVFVLGLANDLWHVTQTAPGGPFGSWEPLYGVSTALGSVTVNSDGRLEVFARGAAFDLRHIAQTSAGGSWGSWAGLGGVVTTSPRVASNADGRLEAFVRGDDGRLRHVSQLSPGGDWSSTWGDLAGYVTSVPAVARQGDALQVVVGGKERTLWHRGQTSPGWSEYFPLEGLFAPY